MQLKSLKVFAVYTLKLSQYIQVKNNQSQIYYKPLLENLGVSVPQSEGVF